MKNFPCRFLGHVCANITTQHALVVRAHARHTKISKKKLFSDGDMCPKIMSKEIFSHKNLVNEKKANYNVYTVIPFYCLGVNTGVRYHSYTDRARWHYQGTIWIASVPAWVATLITQPGFSLQQCHAH